MRTSRATWYEAWAKKSYGAKLCDRFSNLREAKRAIKEANERQISLGYNPQEWIIMIADMISVRDDEGEIISETLTYARV